MFGDPISLVDAIYVVKDKPLENKLLDVVVLALVQISRSSSDFQGEALVNEHSRTFPDSPAWSHSMCQPAQAILLGVFGLIGVCR